MSGNSWELPGNLWNNLDYGHVGYFDLTAENLGRVSSHLRTALTSNGRLGRLTDHSFVVEGANRIFTFVVSFD
ncbi:hypothetical protein ABZ490_14370 [Streptomyces sp. NPDC005811]|uniref:hypothetical protein n=1 Tax=Streptomyces sp. NPDC005811 TaxID=3154565 RepID=UPI0033C0450C